MHGLDAIDELAFADARRLGRVRLRQDPRREPPVSLLGFDALREVPSFDEFRARLRGRTAPVKALLLDQSFAAGVRGVLPDVFAGTLTAPEQRAAAELEWRKYASAEWSDTR